MLIGLATTARAQQPAAPTISIVTKEGQTITTTGVRRAGTAVMAKVKLGGGEGEAGYEAANIARIDFPEPGQLKIAGSLLAQGKADDALKELGPIVAYYAPFKEIPGGWWTPLALLELDAYSRLGRDNDADALAVELGRLGGAVPPDVTRALKIRQGANLERSGKHREALALLEPIAKDENAPPQSLPEAWLSMGAANLALGNNKAALLSYLHVPVYLPDRALVMAPALLGSAAAYVQLDDKAHAREALQQLLAAYPNSREAADARERLRKLTVGKAKDAPKS